LIAPALDALSQAEAAAQASSSADISGIETGQTSRVASAQSQRTQGQAELAGTTRQVENKAESATSEQRRGFSEIERGLLARYGTGVSTGLGASGILGAQALRNISQIRAGAQEALTQIETSRQGLTEVFGNSIRQIESETEGLKQQARSSLQQSLAQIGSARGELQSRKGELVYNAMQNYRNEVNAVNQRNAQFKQNLALKQQEIEGKLQEATVRAQALVQRAGSTASNLSFGNVNPGQTVISRDPKTGEVSPVYTAPGKFDSFLSPTGVGALEDPNQQQTGFGGQLSPEDYALLYGQ